MWEDEISKTIQFRCPECLRLLVKWETGSDTCSFKNPNATFIKQTGSEKQDVICPKCKTRSEITKEGLRKIELVKV